MKTAIRLYILILIASSPLLMLTSCNRHQKVDLIILNAKVYTSDSAFSVKEAVAVSDGKIVFVGTTAEIKQLYESDSTIDLKGKTMLPGLMDAHCHFKGLAEGLVRWVDLKGTKSFEEVINRIREFHSQHPNQWILGRGWDQNDWDIKTFPSKDLLDKEFDSIPVALTRVDGHAMLANSCLLHQVGITAKTKVSGGEIMLTNGQPNGMLIDNAMGLITPHIPALSNELLEQGLLKAQEVCFSLGLTSVVDAGLEYNEIQLIDKLQKSGQLKIRIDAMLSPSEENISNYLQNKPYKTDRLRVGSIKFYADGALGSRGALLIDPYADDEHKCGLRIENPDHFQTYCEMAYKSGFQVNTHAIGDSAVRLMLQVYSSVLKSKNDRRWRIEHAQVVHPADFDLFGKYSIIPSVQPTHATSDMYWAAQRLGNERIKNAYAYKRLLMQNGWMPLGTDFPIESVNPIYTFYAATQRKDLQGFPDTGFQIENALSQQEALYGMTIWAAQASFLEKEIGSIEVGKAADFTVLDTDILTTEPANIPLTKVNCVFISGECVFKTN